MFFHSELCDVKIPSQTKNLYYEKTITLYGNSSYFIYITKNE